MFDLLRVIVIFSYGSWSQQPCRGEAFIISLKGGRFTLRMQRAELKLRSRHEVKQMVAEALLKIVVFTFDRKLFCSIVPWTYLYGMIFLTTQRQSLEINLVN